MWWTWVLFAAMCGAEFQRSCSDQRCARIEIETVPIDIPVRALVVAGEHAREWIPTQVARRLVEYARETHSGTAGTLDVVPMLNADGRNSGMPCWRSAVSGVDLNRNYPYKWRSVAQEVADWGGPRPLSEPESLFVWQRMNETQYDVYISVHSGESSIYTPWDSSSEIPTELCVRGEDTQDLCPECTCGPAGALSDYLATGTAADSAFGILGVPCVFTLEVYGNASATTCHDAFNPPDDEAPRIAQRWSEIILRLVERCASKC